MKNRINILVITLVAIFGGVLTSCNNDDNNGIAEAVMGSSRNIEFPVSDATPTMITIVADGAWRCETPEWLNVTPNSGLAGTTDVTIEVTDNLREGTPDLPRRYVLKFMGDSKRSVFEVTIRQDGDKFRDIQPSSIAQMVKLEEEAAVKFINLPIIAQTNKGFVGTDGKDFVYVTGEGAQARKGQIVDMLGTKMDSDTKLPYVICDQITNVQNGDIPSVEATDITDNIDDYKSDKRTFIKATGIFDGTKLNIEGKTLSITAEDCNSEINLASYAGHILTLTGVYSGTASPVVRMIVTGLEDLGANETVYFLEDFEWFDPYVREYKNTEGKSPSDNVGGEFYSGAYNPQSTTIKDNNGFTTWDLLLAKGYELTSTSTSQAKKSIGVAVNYLKMAVTRYTAALTLPKMPEAGDGVEGVHVKFDWTPMTDGGKKVWDQTEIVVVVETNGTETQFPVAPANLEDGKSLYQWINEDIVLNGIKVNKDSRVTIRNIDADFPDCGAGVKKRWFIDNIKVYKPKN